MLLVMSSLKGYSQTVTQTKQDSVRIDTTKVILSVKTARLVYQDLLKYDGLKEEMSLTKLKLTKLEEREAQKDLIINLLTNKDENNLLILRKKDEQLQISKELTDKLNKELRGQRTKTFLWKVGTFVGLVSTTFFIIK